MESPQIFLVYLLSFGSVMTSLNEEARPARLWISLGMMILVALPSAALPNASSGGKGQCAGKALEQYRGKQRGQCQQRRQGQRTLQQLYGGGSARQRCGCGVPDNGNDTLQYPLAGPQGRTVRRGRQCALQP